MFSISIDYVSIAPASRFGGTVVFGEIVRDNMGGGRKNLKREVEDDGLTLQLGQSIMQVVSLRGSNLIEVIIMCSHLLIEFVKFISNVCFVLLGV